MTELLAIMTLRTKRTEIADALEGLGRQVEQRRADLMHVDATLRLFDPDAEAAPGPKSPLYDQTRHLSGSPIQAQVTL